MTLFKTSYWIAAGLIALVIGLFAAVYVLNIRQYRASLQSVEAHLADALSQQAADMRVHMQTHEAELLLRYAQETAPEAPVLLYTNQVFVPACARYSLSLIPQKEADAAFKKGRELLPSSEAAIHFEKSALGPADSPQAAYQKISALFNLLEIKPNKERIASILTLLAEQKLTESQTLFFSQALKEQVQRIASFQLALERLQADAHALNQLELDQPLPFKTIIQQRILSVHSDGTALYYMPKRPATFYAELSFKPRGRFSEIIPGLYAVTSEQSIEAEKQRIQAQYRRGNVVLSLTMLLAALLIGGIMAALIRQQKLDALRTQFIATVSHELRTPLSLIRLHAETLCHGRLRPEKVPAYHQTILTEAERLTGIVNNVLDFSRMERSQLQIHPEPTNLSLLCEQVCHSFAYRLEKGGVTLQQQMAPNQMALADPLAVSQILFNLFDNALKYSDAQKEICLTLTAEDSFCILTIADRGIGIPAPFRKRIFDDFSRAREQRVTSQRGSGIGLSVARKLTEAMGGTISYKPNEPAGSIFIVSIPALPASPLEAGDTRVPPASSGPPPPNPEKS